MQIIDRKGRIRAFDMERIISAVDKAFLDVREERMPDEFKTVLTEYFGSFAQDMVFDVEAIQDSIEDMLWSGGYKDVAKGYMLYRNEHDAFRALLKERDEYMESYINSADNAASSSETDPNANVSAKNVANLSGETYKTQNRQMQRYRMRKKLKELYPDHERQYIKDIESHIIYIHDEASFPIQTNYTYSPKEVVVIKHNGHFVLASLETIYNLCEENEERQTGDNVWSKFPNDIQVMDKDGKWTKVTRLTKKSRYNDMVRVKTAFGEDIVVTANHPMIVSENTDNTIEASKSKDEKQYRSNYKLEFEGKDEIDLSNILECQEIRSNYIVLHKERSPYYALKRHIKVNRDLGYIVGYFIGDGNYHKADNSIEISQKDSKVLDKLSEMIFEAFGVPSYKNINNNNVKVLSICNEAIKYVFENYFKIKHLAQNKCFPINILQFNEDFAKGIIEGLIDSDGTITDGHTVQIRIASRECILQMNYLLRHFGYGVANGYQNTPFGNNTVITSRYTIWGIVFTNTPKSVKFDHSIKWQNEIKKECQKGLKYKTGWSTITSVSKIEEGSFLNQCENIYDITTESNTFLCNNLWVHNCEAVSLYPFLQHGSSGLDGLGAKGPGHLTSFAGQFTNLVFLLASQCKGAVAFGSFFTVMDWYCTLDFGPDYHRRLDETASLLPKRTILETIDQTFQQIVYGINQPAGNRCAQSPFTNVSYYDKGYWTALFRDVVFPDGTRPEWERVSFLQKHFMKWLNNERTRVLLTFPVETMALLSDRRDIIDKEYKDFTAEMYSEGHSFFTYISDNPNALASCCRLRNEITENVFSFTNGLTGIMTGSCNVISLNFNRITQDWARSCGYSREYLKDNFFRHEDSYVRYLETILERVYKYHIAYKTLLYEVEEKGMLTASNAGYISMRKLYSTIGDNGVNEAAEFLGMKCSYNESYKRFCRLVTGTIHRQDKAHSTDPRFLFNQEFVPAETLSSKNYNWDKADGYWVPEDRVLYNSYFYLADDPGTSILDKFRLHGREFTELLDGGVGLHCNLKEHLSKKQCLHLIDFAIEVGTSYFTFNIPNSECTNPDCHHIVKKPLDVCPKCGARMRQWTRPIGYLRPVDNLDKYRKIEAGRRYYADPDSIGD